MLTNNCGGDRHLIVKFGFKYANGIFRKSVNDYLTRHTRIIYTTSAVHHTRLVHSRDFPNLFMRQQLNILCF